MSANKSIALSTTQLKTIVDTITKFYPAHYADKAWDNTGLLINSSSDMAPAVKKVQVLLTVDLTTAVAQEAIRKKCGLILAYHPFIFPSWKSINPCKNPQPVSYTHLDVYKRQPRYTSNNNVFSSSPCYYADDKSSYVPPSVNNNNNFMSSPISIDSNYNFNTQFNYGCGSKKQPHPQFSQFGTNSTWQFDDSLNTMPTSNLSNFENPYYSYSTVY